MKTLGFKSWLEDTGEVRTGTLSNAGLGVRSKYQVSNSPEKEEFPDPFGKNGSKKCKYRRAIKRSKNG